MTKLYVGNPPFSVTGISDRATGQSRGFGCVVMSTDETRNRDRQDGGRGFRRG